MSSKQTVKAHHGHNTTCSSYHHHDHSRVPVTPTKPKHPEHSHSHEPCLSPLPFPPKNDHVLREVSFTNSYQLMMVVTPVRQPPKTLLQEQEDIHSGISRIIFESSQEDNFNSSSSNSHEEESSESQESRMQESQQSNQSNMPIQAEVVRQVGEMSKEESNPEEEVVRRPPKQRGGGCKDGGSRKIFCNCKKTKCLKLYCDCFRLGLTCGEGCNCTGCHNLQVYAQQRNNAILALMDRNPDPFGQKIEDNRHVKGCNCKKSGCLKKYCECFQAGLKCNQNCKCEDCKNMPPDKHGGNCSGAACVERGRNTAKKEKKMVQL